MARTRKTDKEMATRRDEILDAALAILSDVEAHGVTMRAIAERLGIAPMTIYTYFDDQAALLRALSARETEKLAAPLREVVRRAEGRDIAAAMREMLAVFPWFARTHPQIFALAWVSSTMHSDTRSELLVERQRAIVTPVAQLIQVGIDRRVFAARDAQLAAITIIGIVNFPLVSFHLGRISDSALVDQLVVETHEAALRYLHAEFQEE